MSDKPFRLVVLERLTEHLQGVKPANGYQTDLSKSVFRGRIYYDENDPVPLVSILEDVDPADPLESPRGETGAIRFWDLLIQGWVDDDKENPTDPAHILAADVVNRLAELKKNEAENSANRVLGFDSSAPTIDGIIIGAPVVRPKDEISAKAYFWLRLTLKLVEDDDDPYAS